jgi:hypothetical protein
MNHRLTALRDLLINRRGRDRAALRYRVVVTWALPTPHFDGPDKTLTSVDNKALEKIARRAEDNICRGVYRQGYMLRRLLTTRGYSIDDYHIMTGFEVVARDDQSLDELIDTAFNETPHPSVTTCNIEAAPLPPGQDRPTPQTGSPTRTRVRFGPSYKITTPSNPG